MSYERLTTEETSTHEYLGYRENGEKVLLKSNITHPSGEPFASSPQQEEKKNNYSSPRGITPLFGDVSPWRAILSKKKGI